MWCNTLKDLNAVLHVLTVRITRFLSEYFWFILLAIIMVVFFLINFGYGRFYTFTDISNIELHPWQEFLERFSMWQQTRGFGVELGTEAGYAVPLLFFSFLSAIGFSALQMNFTINMLLFILPSLSVAVLAYSIFYRDPRRNLIAFFAGLLAATSFGMYLEVFYPLFLEVWPWITSALITSAVLLLLQTGKKRFWLVLLVLFYLNWGGFIGLPFAIFPLALGGLYILYYVLVESHNKRQDVVTVILTGFLFVLISLPLIWAVVHTVFSPYFQVSATDKIYTISVFSLNLQNRDFSQLLYGFRTIGTGNWNQIIEMPGFIGQYGYRYYPLFTYNPVFVLSSFLLPVAAFASLLFKESNLLRRRLLCLGIISILFLFLMKGVRDPFGGIFIWLMTHISEFVILRTPYGIIAPALVTSLSISGAYTFSRILPSLRRTSLRKISIGKKSFGTFTFSRTFHSLKKKSVIKKVIVIVLVTALIVDAYPAYSGQLLYTPGFFNIPSYYQQLAAYVKADPVSYKILNLPSISYTNRYSWGYFGITFDGVELNKPVLERSYTGSDIYDNNIINAIQNEVDFESDIPVTPVTGSPIFADNTTPNATINVDRVRYFDYLLEKSNVGQIMLSKDMAGDYSYQLNDNDWQRYNDLYSTLSNLGLISDAQTFGNVTIYDVNNFMPLIYANSPANVYATNNYDTFLGTTYVTSRLEVLASLNNYNTSYDYVSNGSTSSSAIIPNINGKDIYVPILADQDLAEAQNDLALQQSSVIPDKSAIAQDNATVQELTNVTTSDRALTYYVDDIQNSGLFDIYMNLGNSGTTNASSNPYAGKQLVFGNQTVPVSEFNSVGNGWYEIGSVNLDAGNLVTSSDIPQQVQLTFPNGITEDELPANIIVENTPVYRLNNGTWVVKLSFETNTYSSLEQLLTDTSLDANFRQDIANALNVKVTPIEFDLALVSTDMPENNSIAPTLVFRQIQPGKLLVNAENASGPFFLNFLESYQEGWQLYVVPTQTLGDAPPVRNYAGSTELEQASTPFPDSHDLTPLLSTSVLGNDHFLLNGYANSWYVNLTALADQHMITQDANGTYSFTLLLYYEPQTNFVLGIGVSIITGVIVCALICYSILKVRARSKKLKQKSTIQLSSHRI